MQQGWGIDRIETLLGQLEALIGPRRTQTTPSACAAPRPLFQDQVTISDKVMCILALRRKRERVFDDPIFGEPAWDIILDLFRARLRNEAVSITSACIAASVPQTTALRWISVLCDKNYITREPDPADARRSLLSLSDESFEKMKLLLERL